VFELRNPGNELYTVLGILKQLEQVALNEKMSESGFTG